MVKPNMVKSANDIEKVKSKAELKRHWYIFYTAPRAEKKIQQELSLQGYEVFLPVSKTLRTWKNRQKKMVDHVLFPSYIFVNTEERYLYKICQTPKIMTFLRFGNKPSIINFNRIEGIKRMLGLKQEITVEHNLYEGKNVRIIYGPLADCEGILLKQNSRTRFGIELKEINLTVFIDIYENLSE